MIDQNIINWYLDADRHLVPLIGKRPRDVNWQTTIYSRDQLENHTGNLGWRLGPRDVVLDVDPRNDGWLSLARLESDLHLEWLTDFTPVVQTGSGGLHVYLRLPNESSQLKPGHRDYPGIDVKKQGGQVVIAGSEHPDTKRLYTLPDTHKMLQVLEIPKELIDLYAYEPVLPSGSDDAEIITPEQLEILLGQIPVTEYDSNDTWFALLAAAAHATDGAGLDVFLEWSLGDSRYANQSAEIAARWRSVCARPGSRGVGTLIRVARQHGGEGLPNIRQDEMLTLLESNPLPPPKSTVKKTELVGATQWDLATLIADDLLRSHYSDGATLCYASDQEFWGYDDRRWTSLNKGALEGVVYKSAVSFCRAHAVKKVDMAPILSKTVSILRARASSDMDPLKPPTMPIGMALINCRNGTVELNARTGEANFREHRAEDRLITLLDVDFDIEADCPLFYQTLSDIFDGLSDKHALIATIFEIYGYALQPVKNIPAWFLLYGAGRNGKSVILRVLGALLGNAAVHRGLKDFMDDKHALSDLVGALAVIDDDLQANTLLRDDFLKKVTENKVLVANPKYKKAFNFLTQTTVLMASNHWPQSRDLSDGMLRRAHVIPFLRQFELAEIDLDRAQRIIEGELSGVLRHSLEGLVRLRRRGHFALPPVCKRAAEQWTRASNQAAVFESELFQRVADENVKFPVREVWDAYRAWCLDAGMQRTFNRHRLVETLRSYGWCARTINGTQYFLGIERKK